MRLVIKCLVFVYFGNFECQHKHFEKKLEMEKKRQERRTKRER